MYGDIFDIQRFSIGNGPGIRTTVFLRGCSLRCLWCHNPESFSRGHQIKLNRRLCRLCGMCQSVCPRNVHSFSDGIHNMNTEECIACGACEKICCYGAVTLVGRKMSSEGLADILLRDADYYRASGGGVTFSGGEPLLQFPFIESVMDLIKGVNVYMDTCGNCDETVFDHMLNRADGLLFDLKHMNREYHRKLTGAPNDKILRNFQAAVKKKISMQVRFPMIPGQNDDDKNISDLCRFLLHYGISELEVSPYHDYGTQKYSDLGLQAHFFPKYTERQLEERLDVIRSCKVIPRVI